MDLKDTATIVQSLVDANRERNALYKKIDDAVNCIFNPSPELTKLPFIKNRHYALTDIADARNAGVRTFAVLLPLIEVLPNSDNDYEYERVERIEEVLSWEFKRMNRVTADTVHSRIIESAINYHAVALQTQYLPYHYKKRKNEPKIKALLRQKSFNWIVHHPGSVYVDYDRYDNVNGVAKISEYNAKQLIDIYGSDNPGVMKILERINAKSKDALLNSKWKVFDWTDWERRQIWAAQEGRVEKSEFVIMDEEHGLPFIPWVVVNKGNPLWEGVIRSGMWENAQHMNIIRFAKSIEQASAPSMVIQTPDGTLKGVWIDPTNPSNPMQIPAGANVRELQRPQIDPQLEAHFNEMRASIQRSTVSQVLTDIGQYSNAPFSTVNQIVQMALGQLAPAKQVAEDAEARAFYQMFEWIEHSKIPLIGYRDRNRDGRTGEAARYGETIGIFPGPQPEPDEQMTPDEIKAFRQRIYFDLDALYITVNMKSQNTADEQARQNVVINSVTHMGASKEWAWEQMGYQNFRLVQEQRAEEILEEAEIQKIVALKQLEVQQAQMQMQTEAQQAQMQAQQPQNAVSDRNSENAMSTMQGADMRGGMNPASQAAPGMTRETVTGMDALGAEI